MRLNFIPHTVKLSNQHFFKKIEKANGPSSNEDFLWYETSTNNKQLQLQ